MYNEHYKYSKHPLCGNCLKRDSCKSIGKDSYSLIHCDKRVTL